MYSSEIEKEALARLKDNINAKNSKKVSIDEQILEIFIEKAGKC